MFLKDYFILDHFPKKSKFESSAFVLNTKRHFFDFYKRNSQKQLRNIQIFFHISISRIVDKKVFEFILNFYGSSLTLNLFFLRNIGLRSVFLDVFFYEKF
jgi:hypothetical protein